MITDWINKKVLGAYIARIKQRKNVEDHCALSLLLEMTRIENNKFFDSQDSIDLINSFDNGWDGVFKFVTAKNKP